MSEYAVMPLADYQAACDKIREKTGKTETIKSGAMAAEIDSIHVGGGSDPSDMEAQWIAAIERGRTQVTKIPTGVTSIGNKAFFECSNLALTELPAGVTSIGNSAFKSCGSLNCSLPSVLKQIESDAFNGCSMKSLTSIPHGVDYIGYQAFRNCWFTEITFEGTPTTIGSEAFKSCTKLTTINVPWAEGEVANAPWGATNATINYNYTGG